MGSEGSKFDPEKLTEEQRRKLEQGKPINVTEHVKVTLNPKTGLIEGLPKQWEKYNTVYNVDQTKTVKYKNLGEHLRPIDTKLPDKILEIIERPIISKPMNVKHEIHLALDPSAPFGISGLPEEWVKHLGKDQKLAQISKENPKVLFQIVSNFENKIEPKNALLSKEQFQRKLSEIKIEEVDPSSKYTFQYELGKGAMCKVFRCSEVGNKDNVFACRLMKLTEEQFQRVKTEIVVMDMCKHPTIVQYVTTYLFKKCLFMMVEYMDAGCLTDFIYAYPRAIPEKTIAFISREIFTGLRQMHKKFQIHRDLKSDNILVKSDGSVKIADFGFATQLTKDKCWRKSTVGTPAWMAPELISKRQYNEMVDVWSAGMIVYQLAETEPPFLRFPPSTSMFLICQRDAPRLADKKKYSPEFCSFIERCLEKDPKKRWSTEQLLKHPFLAQVEGAPQKAELSTMLKNKPPKK